MKLALFLDRAVKPHWLELVVRVTLDSYPLRGIPLLCCLTLLGHWDVRAGLDRTNPAVPFPLFTLAEGQRIT